jgi:two-component system phosphate regulon sensor histidine kinase PhoR
VWTSKLFWKLFLVYAGLSLLLAAAFLWRVSGLFDQFVERQVSTGLEKIAQSLLVQPLTGDAEQKREQLSDRAKRVSLLREQRLLLLDDQGVACFGPSIPGTEYLSLPSVQAALGGTVAHNSRKLQNGDLLVEAAVPVQNEQTVFAVIYLTQTWNDFDSQLMVVRRDLSYFAVVTGCVAVILTYLVVSQIVRPLTQLTAGAQALAADDDSNLLTTQSLDELGVLGAAFNQMQTKLSRRVEQLKENTERLETVLGSMEEGVIAVDAQDAVLLANEASRDLLDIGVVYPQGRLLLDVTRSLPLQTAVTQALQTRGTVQQEFETHGSVRRTLAIRATCMPGEPCPGVMVVLRDVSELRRLENLRREFVANVSHELKTPLAAIKAYAETLKMGALHDPENGPTFLTRIEEQSERLHELIIDLLQIARMESGQEAFEIVDLDLAEAVLDCVDQFMDVAAAKMLVLNVQGPENDAPVIVRGDEEGVRTIISNLINNAIKYTPAGGSVMVRWRVVEDMGVIEVEDTGIGIALKDQARIFERFYRVDKARSREMGGTGLGLSIVKHLTQAFGGVVGVESQPHQGSTFSIRLPLSTR